ncbi:hypothetical protein [Actinoplanes sp. DH11]|uniref:hypothetical protein n=1 Tax=Actinoplanes sp. DH11 TaxID=2857011 RepID=UPI001E2BBCC4|nr:hypothetical protein [Actinoplanes sp. DH11]
MPRRSPRWIWAGRIVFGLVAAGLIAYLVRAGLDDADKLASCAGAVLALSALVAPYLLPPGGREPGPAPHRVEDSGAARATGGGRAVSGAEVTGGGPVQVARSGDAVADGPGSSAVSGVVRRPEP